MEIEQKERERIEAKYPTERQGLEVKTMFHWMDVQLSRQGSAMEEHLHLQKEVIQPLRKQYNDLGVKFDKEVERWQERDEKERSIRFKLEAENKALREERDRHCQMISNMREIIGKSIDSAIDQLLTKNEG